MKIYNSYDSYELSNREETVVWLFDTFSVEVIEDVAYLQKETITPFGPITETASRPL